MALTITLGEIPALDHKFLDDTMELGAFISKSFFASRQRSIIRNELEYSTLLKEPHT
jgi:hypothetical protein